MRGDRLTRQRRMALVFLYSVSLLIGIPDAFAMGPHAGELPVGFASRTQWFMSLLFGLGSLWFCTVDAKLAGRPLMRLAKVGIFLFWPIGVPIYLLSVRGVRGLGVLLLHGFLLLLVCICSTFAAGYLLYGRAFFDFD